MSRRRYQPNRSASREITIRIAGVDRNIKGQLGRPGPMSDDPAYLEHIKRVVDQAPPFSERQIAYLGAVWAPHVEATIAERKSGRKPQRGAA